MELYIHNVGKEGADRDFPKTVFSRVPISVVEANAPGYLRDEMVGELRRIFPSGSFNCWGVPEGARPIIRKLAPADAVLLMRTIAGEGEITALGVVKAFWRDPMLDLSHALWGSAHFPYVFFFDTTPIELTWAQFREDVGFSSNYRVPPHFVRVAGAEERLAAFGGVRGYVSRLAGTVHYGGDEQPATTTSENTPESEYLEGERLLRERAYFRRNPRLVKEAKERYGYRCQACGFDFRERYGELGAWYIECHHLSPLSEREGDEPSEHSTSLDDVAVLCSNCHRMVHRRRPALSLAELQSLVR